MKKSIILQIPSPCHEDWQKMTQTEKGKFCSVCTKEVIDFTSKTDEDLVKQLANSSNVCGRFKINQLNREVKLERKSGLNLAPFAASLLVPISLFANTNSDSTTLEKSSKSFSSIGIGSLAFANRALVTTKGIITDQNGNPLNNVKITSAETNKISFSTKKGNYSITSLDHEILIFSKKDFQEHEISTGTYKITRDVTLFSEMPMEHIQGRIGPEPVAVCEIISGDVIQTVEVESITELNDSKFLEITGNVTDESGMPLPGVNVIIKGIITGTTTDFDGNYSIQSKHNQILSFIYIGYITQEITISNISNSIDIQLQESGEVLGGMIIVERID